MPTVSTYGEFLTIEEAKKLAATSEKDVAIQARVYYLRKDLSDLLVRNKDITATYHLELMKFRDTIRDEDIVEDIAKILDAAGWDVTYDRGAHFSWWFHVTARLPKET